VFLALTNERPTKENTMSNPFSYAELHTQDPTAAKAFYGQLFDWKMHDHTSPKGTYTEIDLGEGLPPLMFDEAEIEALVLARASRELGGRGARARRAQRPLEGRGRAAGAPARSHPRRHALRAELPRAQIGERRLGAVRAAIKARRKVALAYRDRGDTSTERTVQPLGVFYWGASWSIGAWGQLRRDFRNFRLDASRSSSCSTTPSRTSPDARSVTSSCATKTKRAPTASAASERGSVRFCAARADGALQFAPCRCTRSSRS